MHHGNAQAQDTRHSGTYDADRVQYHGILGEPWPARVGHSLKVSLL